MGISVHDGTRNLQLKNKTQISAQQSDYNFFFFEKSWAQEKKKLICKMSSIWHVCELFAAAFRLCFDVTWKLFAFVLVLEPPRAHLPRKKLKYTQQQRQKKSAGKMLSN